MSSQFPRVPSPSTSNPAAANEPKQEPKQDPVLSSYASVTVSSCSVSSATLPTPAIAKQRIASLWRRISCTDHLMQDIDPAHATVLLWCFCFMSGFINAVPFTAVLLWCGFQTRNTAQLAVAIGRFLSSEKANFVFEVADQQALTSLLSCLSGGCLGRCDDRMGSNRRSAHNRHASASASYDVRGAHHLGKCGAERRGFTQRGRIGRRVEFCYARLRECWPVTAGSDS